MGRAVWLLDCYASSGSLVHARRHLPMPIQQRTDARRLAHEVPSMAIACVLRPYGSAPQHNTRMISSSVGCRIVFPPALASHTTPRPALPHLACLAPIFGSTATPHRVIRAIAAPSSCAVILVGKNPGAIALTVMPSGAHFSPRTRRFAEAACVPEASSWGAPAANLP
jgi:hypothetical protein